MNKEHNAYSLIIVLVSCLFRNCTYIPDETIQYFVHSYNCIGKEDHKFMEWTFEKQVDRFSPSLTLDIYIKQCKDMIFPWEGLLSLSDGSIIRSVLMKNFLKSFNLTHVSFSFHYYFWLPHPNGNLVSFLQIFRDTKH